MKITKAAKRHFKLKDAVKQTQKETREKRLSKGDEFDLAAKPKKFPKHKSRIQSMFRLKTGVVNAQTACEFVCVLSG